MPYPHGIAPGQRYRTEQWEPYLRERGVELTFSSFADEELNSLLYRPGLRLQKATRMLERLLSRFSDAWAAARYDGVLVQREAALLGPALSERVARRRNPLFVYDFDDAVHLPYVSPTNRYLSLLKFPWKTKALCRMADLVVAGNRQLADFARRLTKSTGQVEVVPSTISLRSYPRRVELPIRAVPVIGWTGSHSSAQYLRVIENALRVLATRVRFRLLLIGPATLEIPGVEVERRPWNAAREVEDLWDMDLGVMPLPDLPWTRGKCGMKALQYMAAGLSAVVSPVGVNQEIVVPGETGLHASTDAEWADALERLIRDPSLRSRMGDAGRKRVEESYSAEVHAPRLARAIWEAASRRSPSDRR